MTNIDSRRQQLIAQVATGFQPEYLFFWSHRPKPGGVTKSCLSQWHEGSPFTVDDVTYRSAEHFMMAAKARLFGDEEARAQVLAAPSPASAKQIGRSVRNFDEARWKAECFDIVVRASVAKFSQNPAMGEFLLRTGERVLVEASPRDRIWGIGMGAANPDAEQPRKWRGQNLLGFALMAARAQLRGGQ